MPTIASFVFAIIYGWPLTVAAIIAAVMGWRTQSELTAVWLAVLVVVAKWGAFLFLGSGNEEFAYGLMILSMAMPEIIVGPFILAFFARRLFKTDTPLKL